jgi:RNA polymerase-binding transcription factor DksA
MATSKKSAASAKKTAKKPAAKATPKKVVKKPAPKKAAPAKKPAPAKKAAAPVKKTALPLKKSAAPAKKSKIPEKKSAPVKKSAPAKKAAKPAAKATPKKMTKPAPKKVAPVAKAKAPAAKKVAAPVKKAVHPAPAKKAAPVVKQEPKANHTNKPTSLPPAKDIKVAKPKPVVLPKITSKKVRPYEPDFTKSVLDKHVQQSGGPSQRYSDSDLNEFRELITRKLDTAKKELAYLQGLITRKDEMGGDESDNRYMTMEDGSLSMEREQLSQMASRQITFIDHLEKALMRIENKTYGICRVTGKLIDKARLRAVPHATLSIEAKMGMK